MLATFGALVNPVRADITSRFASSVQLSVGGAHTTAERIGSSFAISGSGVDTTGELKGTDLAGAKRLTYTDNGEDLSGCGIFVVAVPTPVNETNQPEFSPLVAASRTVGSVLDQGGIVIYESTVYPGATE